MEVEKVGGEVTGKDLEGKSNNVENVDAPAAENAEVKADGTEGAEAADAVKEEAPKKMVAPSKLKLRLDDGSLCSFVVESKEVSLLSSDEAHKAGLLKENHLLRMQSFLCEVHAKLPNEGPLKRYVVGGVEWIVLPSAVSLVSSASASASASVSVSASASASVSASASASASASPPPVLSSHLISVWVSQCDPPESAEQ